ncbi:hypothetical protein DLM77_21130 [Leptospira yasudae]|uniref:Intein C-terminal splicing domain-containing protein n=1 Tax=Leptospira yasudae TaxID=2202201 RepID=A0ABX9LY41_9LEPT|nr:hypothetical protein DLM77_21130 [Leptospira yasudae]
MVNERSWVKVKDLKVGDIVQLQDGSQVPITRITPYSLSMTSVYNLEVEENHTYYVGKEGVLVHNYDPSTYKGNVGTELLLGGGGGGGSSTGLGLAAFFTAMQNFFGSDGNPNENKPQTPALPRDPSLTQNEAEQMRRVGLDPMNSKDIKSFFDSVNKDYKFADSKELAKKLNISDNDIHGVKRYIIKQFQSDMIKNGMGTNPDIGWDSKGHLLLKDRISGKVLNTFVPLEYFKN